MVGDADLLGAERDRAPLRRPVDDGLAAFANTCRHRGVTLEHRDRGEASRFVCPFHAWTYANRATVSW